MTKKRDRQEKLLAEIFHGDWADGPAGQFARAAATLARRRKITQRALVVSAAALAIAAASMLSLPPRRAPVPAQPAVAKAKPAYEIISDEELLAQLHDRPLLMLTGKNGAKEFVVLER